jgi:hypothetical protein
MHNSSKPAGVFIQELAVTMMKAANVPEIQIGNEQSQCATG